MTTSILNRPARAADASLGKTVAAPRVQISLRDWLAVFKSALAMTSAVPTAGRVGARQVEQVRAIAAKL